MGERFGLDGFSRVRLGLSCTVCADAMLYWRFDQNNVRAGGLD